MIPSAEKCFELMEKYGMPDNIKAHSIVVEKVAYIIAIGNIDAGFNISVEKVIAASLMHDIGKNLCLNSRDNHAEKGKEICIQNKLFEIADIVGEHIKLKNYQSEGPVMDNEIVYYADKRVNHDKVVSLDERLEYLLVRYANNKEIIARLIKENFQECREVEKKLFDRLNFRPEDLPDMIRQINNNP
jgi:uncharacterized protein